MYFVYELVDPRTDVAGYIGITDNPNRRYSEHIEGREGKGKKYNWIQRLQEEQIQPKMKILEIVDDLEQAKRQERRWIQHYLSKGTQLANTLLTKPPRSTTVKATTTVCNNNTSEKNIDAIEEKLRQWVIQDDLEALKIRQQIQDGFGVSTPIYVYTSEQTKQKLGIGSNALAKLVERGLIKRVTRPGYSTIGRYTQASVDRYFVHMIRSQRTKTREKE